MSRAPSAFTDTVCVVSAQPTAAWYALEQFAQNNRIRLAVHHAGSLSVAARTYRHAILVVDLASPPPSANPSNTLLKRHLVTIVLPGGPEVDQVVPGKEQPVWAAWIPWMRNPAVRVLRVVPHASDPFVALLALVERFAVGLGAGWLTDKVVHRVPKLAEVQDLALLILQEPWDIRRPADLARRAQVTPGLLRHRCHGIGARHMAHLITQVRCVAFEYLIDVERLSRGRARIICGINDEADFRKQVARARYSLRPIGPDG